MDKRKLKRLEEHVESYLDEGKDKPDWIKKRIEGKYEQALKPDSLRDLATAILNKRYRHEQGTGGPVAAEDVKKDLGEAEYNRLIEGLAENLKTFLQDQRSDL